MAGYRRVHSIPASGLGGQPGFPRIAGSLPYFECPETNQQIQIIDCVECSLYQEWDDSEVRKCRHDYEWGQAKEEADQRRLEEVHAESDIFMQQMREDARKAEEDAREYEEYLEASRDEQKREQEASWNEFHKSLDEMTANLIEELPDGLSGPEDEEDSRSWDEEVDGDNRSD